MVYGGTGSQVDDQKVPFDWGGGGAGVLLIVFFLKKHINTSSKNQFL